MSAFRLAQFFQVNLLRGGRIPHRAMHRKAVMRINTVVKKQTSLAVGMPQCLPTPNTLHWTSHMGGMPY